MSLGRFGKRGFVTAASGMVTGPVVSLVRPAKKAADRCNRRQEKEFLLTVSLDEDVLHRVCSAKYVVALFLKESHCYAIASLVKRIFLSIFDLFAMPSLSLSVSNLPDTVSPDRLLASFTLFLKKSLCRSL